MVWARCVGLSTPEIPKQWGSMTAHSIRAVAVWVGVVVVAGWPTSQASGQTTSTSELATWTCTGSPCPWGSSLDGQAVVWPASSGAVSQRLGYTVSGGIYLVAPRANGATLTVVSGSAQA